MPDWSNQSGQGIVEYALIIILVIIVIFVIASLLGDFIINWIRELIDSFRTGLIYPVS